MRQGKVAHMIIEPRSYQGEHDLDKMKSVLIAGLGAGGPTHYAHVGDLDWWLFYLAEGDFQEDVYLWEDEESDRGVIGWSLLSPQYKAFDVFVHPAHVDGELAGRMFQWTELKLRDIVGGQAGSKLNTMWVAEDDQGLISRLENQGFRQSDYHMHYLRRELGGPVSESEPQLPSGYRARHVLGTEEVDKRAAVSRAAFESSLPTDAYTRRYLRFMGSPAYAAHRDLVVEALDGQFAAFCIYWIDDVNRIGLFEPVGTHPDFRRRGLAKAILESGLQRMKAEGMETAVVCVESENSAAQRLYHSIGFHLVRKIRTYVKQL